MRILFLNDTSLMSGAERCLLDLLTEIKDEVQPLVACPLGPLSEAIRALGVDVVAVRGTEGSLRMHPWQTPRALAALAASAVVVRRLAARHRIELIHANSMRSSLVAAGARSLGGPPFTAFIHDALPGGRPARLSSAAIRAAASMLFANSDYSADRFGLAGDEPRRRVVFNPLDLATFDPARHDRSRERSRLGLARDDIVLAMVAQITPWKGQREALEMFDEIRRGHPRARLLIVGEAKFVSPATRYDNTRYLAELRQLVRDRGLESSVRWLGERDDVPAILAAVDILVVPSWAEPFGRVVVEGMAMGRLVVATSVGGPAEIISDGIDGLLLPPRDPKLWARTLSAVMADPAGMQAIRDAAPQAVTRFDRSSFARAMLDGFEAALD